MFECLELCNTFERRVDVFFQKKVFYMKVVLDSSKSLESSVLDFANLRKFKNLFLPNKDKQAKLCIDFIQWPSRVSQEKHINNLSTDQIVFIYTGNMIFSQIFKLKTLVMFCVEFY